MLTKTLKRKLEPRVSESTLQKLNWLTGDSVRELQESRVQVLVDGELYEVEFDSTGRAVARKIIDAPR